MRADNPPATNTTPETRKYHIESAATGVSLGMYEAPSRISALHKFARDAGYDDYDDLKQQMPRSHKADVTVTCVNL